MLPAACFLDRLPPPKARSAIEVEEYAATRPSGVLQHKMPVEQDGFHFSQERIMPVDVRPARLHHPDVGISEVVDGAHQEIFRRREVCVKDDDELAFCGFQSLGKRPGLKPLAIAPVMIGNRISQPRVAVHQHSSYINRFIGRVIQ